MKRLTLILVVASLTAISEVGQAQSPCGDPPQAPVCPTEGPSGAEPGTCNRLWQEYQEAMKRYQKCLEDERRAQENKPKAATMHSTCPPQER